MCENTITKRRKVRNEIWRVSNVRWKAGERKQWTWIFQYFRTIIRLLAGVPLLHLMRENSSLSSPEFSSITMLFSIRIRLETNSVYYHRDYLIVSKTWGRELHIKHYYKCFIKNTYLELSEHQLISIGKQAFKIFTHDRKIKDANITFWKLTQRQSSKYKLNERRARRVGEGDKSDPHLVSAILANSFLHRDCSIWRYLSASRTAREILRSCCTAPKVSAAQDTLCAHRTIMSNWCLTRSTRSTDSLSVHSGASSWRYAKFNPFNEPWRTTTNWQMPHGQFGHVLEIQPKALLSVLHDCDSRRINKQ